MTTHALCKDILATLIARGESLSLAESCTGGLVAAALTDIPGASLAFWGCIVAYDYDVKERSLGVSRDALQRYGAVSEEVAAAMAEGAQKAMRTTWALSITGIAGPDGATPTKPVGTVCFAVAGPNGIKKVRKQFADLGRDQNREQFKIFALQLLGDVIL